MSELSVREQCILDLLRLRGEQYGLELVERSGGQLVRGTVYVWLARLEDRGLVARRRESGPQADLIPERVRRNLYRIAGTEPTRR